MTPNKPWTAVRKALTAATVISTVTLLSATAGAPCSSYTVYAWKSPASPQGNLTWDAAGNLYSTTNVGGANDAGTVFELSPRTSGGWTEKILHNFPKVSELNNGTDGSFPGAGVIFDAAGNLYGTTSEGGNGGYPGGICTFPEEEPCGVVFELSPTASGGWTEKILLNFNGGDGGYPYGGLIFDAAGNLYGTTLYGGDCITNDIGCGVVFELSPAADGKWNETVVHSFPATATDGYFPYAGVIFDAVGNLYGTTYAGGAYGSEGGGIGYGMVFELSRTASGDWTEKTLHNFEGPPTDGWSPNGLTFDAAGNLYGTTFGGGTHADGTVFKLERNSDGSWTEKILLNFNGGDGGNPHGGLIFDAAGNLYGTTNQGGDLSCNTPYGCGTVFKLSPDTDGQWTESVLHRFWDTPGAYPTAGLVFDKAGNLYGTSEGDAKKTFGSVIEIVR